MDMDNYNERLNQFEAKINALEESILKNTLKMEDISDFNQFVLQVENLLQEYTSIYDSLEHDSFRSHLVNSLEKENDFLLLLVPVINHLLHYHHVIGFVEKAEIKSEWEDVRKLIFFNSQVMHKRETLYNELNDNFVRIVNPLANHKEKASRKFTKLTENLKNLQGPKEMMEAYERIETLGQATNRIREVSLEGYEPIDAQSLQDIGNETLDALNHLFSKEQTDKHEPIVVEEKTLVIDEQYLKSLVNLTDKILYIKGILANIEKASGKKVAVKYRKTTKRISSKYKSRWILYQNKLNSYMEKYNKEISNADSLEETENLAEEYAHIYEDFLYAEERLFSLVREAKQHGNSKDVIAVASYNKEPLYILKKDLDRFNIVFMKYKKYQARLKEFSAMHDFEFIDCYLDVETIEDTTLKIYKEIEKLKQNDGLALRDEEEKKLRKKLYAFNKGKKLAVFANLKVALKSTFIGSTLEKVFMSAALNPDEFIKDSRYSDEEKKNVFNVLMEKLNAAFTNKEKTNILEDTYLKIKSSLNKIPKDKKHVLKVKNVKEATRKKVLIGALSTAVVGISILGLNALRTSSILPDNSLQINEENDEEIAKDYRVSIDENKTAVFDLDSENRNSSLENLNTSNDEFAQNINKLLNSDSEKQSSAIAQQNLVNRKEDILISNPTPEKEEYHDFGDTFTTEGIIYSNQYDMASEKNGVPTYFDALNVRTVGGIVYLYNGEKITIFENDLDANAKKAALENNGAKQIGYVGRMENSNSNGYEGFFNESESHFINDTIERKGR